MYYSKDDIKGRDKYEGEWKDGLPNGKGNLIYKNGEKYDGEFSKDIFNGKAIHYFNDGDIYDGEFKMVKSM